MVYEERYFILDNLNTRITNIELGYMEAKDRPTPVSETTLNSSSVVSLKQSGSCCSISIVQFHSFNFFFASAAQMWLFARILPILLGDYIPEDDERWENFLRMMDIVDRLLSPKVSEDDATYIKWLISDHHREFCRLYPESSVIPKMHFMVHMPRLIVQ